MNTIIIALAAFEEFMLAKTGLRHPLSHLVVMASVLETLSLNSWGVG